MILSFYAQVRKSDVEIIITQENAFVNDETEKSENKRKGWRLPAQTKMTEI